MSNLIKSEVKKHDVVNIKSTLENPLEIKMKKIHVLCRCEAYLDNFWFHNQPYTNKH